MFVNETKIDMELNLKANDHMAGRKARIMFLIASLLFLVAGGISLASDLLSSVEGEPDYFFSVFSFIMFAVLLALTFAFGAINKKTLQKMSQGKETNNKYTFAEGGYEIYSEINDGTISTVKGGYQGFTEVREYGDMWLLYLNKATVFAVSKSGMTEGTAEDLSAFLRRAIGIRYKVCYKAK